MQEKSSVIIKDILKGNSFKRQVLMANGSLIYSYSLSLGRCESLSLSNQRWGT